MGLVGQTRAISLALSIAEIEKVEFPYVTRMPVERAFSESSAGQVGSAPQKALAWA